ncbi:MAG: hypothetical protein JNJ50_24220 [Acidobacteria bacterium]|nr:hypothetical protein [Acidobacteriota bacterium]
MMKNIKLLVSLAVSGLCLQVAFAQNPSNGNRRLNVQYDAQTFNLVNANRSLNIKVDKQDRADVLAIKLASNSEPVKVMGWALNYSKSRGAGGDAMNFKGLESVDSLSSSSFAFNGAELIINTTRQNPHTRIVLHVSLPSDLSVSLQINDKLVSVGPLTKGILIKGGKIIDSAQGTDPKMTLMEALMTPLDGVMTKNVEESIVPPPPSRPDLPWQVSWSKLEKLAIGSHQDIYSGGETSGCVNCRFAVLQIVVGNNGLVIEGQKLTGGNEIGEAALQSLRQWQFRPFLVDNQPVKVKAIVTVKVVNGRLVYGNKP